MLRSIVSFALRFRLVVLLLAAVLLVCGGLALREAPWDVFPEFAPGLIIVQTEAPGLSAEEVERLVTLPVEAALGGVRRIETLRSSSIPGLSVVTAVFAEGTDILQARQAVSERLAEVAPRLPRDVGPPRMAPLMASTSRILMLGLTLKQGLEIGDWGLEGDRRSESPIPNPQSLFPGFGPSLIGPCGPDSKVSMGSPTSRSSAAK